MGRMNDLASRHPVRRPWSVLAAAAALVAALLALLPARVTAAPVYQTLDELEGSTIAYINGSVYGLAVAEKIDGTTEVYYPSLPDCVAAVESGKAEAACGISYCCELAAARSNGAVELLPERVKDIDEAFFFAKGCDHRSLTLFRVGPPWLLFHQTQF